MNGRPRRNNYTLIAASYPCSRKNLQQAVQTCPWEFDKVIVPIGANKWERKIERWCWEILDEHIRIVPVPLDPMHGSLGSLIRNLRLIDMTRQGGAIFAWNEWKDGIYELLSLKESFSNSRFKKIHICYIPNRYEMKGIENAGFEQEFE